MTAPPRWRDPDSQAPEGVRALLEVARKTRPMTAAERERSAGRVARLGAVPVTVGQRRRRVVEVGRLVPSSGPPVEVSVTPVVVGCDPSCDLVLPVDEEVSVVHCEIRATPKGVLVRDLGSKNGTFVGGVHVREAYLTTPCVLRVGSSEIRFEPAGKELVEIAADEQFGDLVGTSTAMRRVFQQLRDIAQSNRSVLITGETGTGKELVAKAIHDHSPRRKGPFEVLDCTTIVSTLAESLLFGHERNCFPGALRTDGAFREAHGGTIFLDELGDLPLDLQPKLLRALADRRVKRLGGKSYDEVDVRVISATHQNLIRNVNTKQFRSDLYFRLAQMRIELPPLRERREDIPVIVRAKCMREGHPERADEITARLTSEPFASRSWYGNVRELVNEIEFMLAVPAGSELPSLPPDEEAAGAAAGPIAPFVAAKRTAIDAFERSYFMDLYEATEGNVSEMARKSGMERHHVRRYLRRLGLRGR